jgi:hypothetical protein
MHPEEADAAPCSSSSSSGADGGRLPGQTSGDAPPSTSGRGAAGSLLVAPAADRWGAGLRRVQVQVVAGRQWFAPSPQVTTT